MVMLKEFHIGRGVCRGDTLSSFLFIIDTEDPRATMAEAIDKNIYKGVDLPNNGPKLSIFQYMDDVIFIEHWSKENVLNLMRVHRWLPLASGLKVNLAKSKVFSVGVGVEEIESMECYLNCSQVSFLFSYLGIPMGARMTEMGN